MDLKKHGINYIVKKFNLFRFLLLLVALFCIFQLGRIHEETAHMERIVECVKVPDNIDINTFYGHGITTELFNHAIGHNAHFYMQCIWKDLYR